MTASVLCRGRLLSHSFAIATPVSLSASPLVTASRRVSTNSFAAPSAAFPLAYRPEMEIRMRQFEDDFTRHRLDSQNPFIIRADGVKFSTLTQHFDKPFDIRMARAMVRSAADAMAKFTPTCVYTASDEITLVFPGRKLVSPEQSAADQRPMDNSEWMKMYSGKLSKIVSVVAGYITARFNYHLTQEARLASAAAASGAVVLDNRDAEDEAKALQTMQSGTAFFDARAFSVPNDEECLENVMWRMHDCNRNSANLLARSLFSQSKLHGVPVADVLKWIKAEGINWEDNCPHFTGGTLIKRKHVMRTGLDPRTGENVEVLRSEVAFASAAVLKSRPFQYSLDLISKRIVGEKDRFNYDLFKSDLDASRVLEPVGPHYNVRTRSDTPQSSTRRQ